MAIYTETTDPNETAGITNTKDSIIDDINNIVSEYGSFSVYDVDADHSPFINSRGRLTHLMEEFETDGGVVRVYDPTSHSSDELDEYFENYSELDLNQLEYILELAQQFMEVNED